jgi:hypothetical protein
MNDICTGDRHLEGKRTPGKIKQSGIKESKLKRKVLSIKILIRTKKNNDNEMTKRMRDMEE